MVNQKGGKLSGAVSVHKLFYNVNKSENNNDKNNIKAKYAPCNTFPLFPLKLNQRFKFQESVRGFDGECVGVSFLQFTPICKLAMHKHIDLFIANDRIQYFMHEIIKSECNIFIRNEKSRERDLYCSFQFNAVGFAVGS